MDIKTIPITGKYLSHAGEVEASSITAPYIGLLFGGSWCPGCRKLISVLEERYEELNAGGKKVEIIFVSSDQDQADFDYFFKSMPWLAIPFGDER